MKLNELKFKNMHNASTITDKWDSLPEHYQNFFYTVAVKEIHQWIEGGYIGLRGKERTHLGQSFKLMRYLIEPSELSNIREIYRTIHINNTKSKPKKYYKKMAEYINDKGNVLIKTNLSNYQSWTSSLKTINNISGKDSWRKPLDTVSVIIFTAPLQHALFSTKDLLKQLTILNDYIGRNSSISDFVKMLPLFVQQENEVIVNAPGGKMKISHMEVL